MLSEIGATGPKRAACARETRVRMNAFPARRPVAWVALALATFTLNASWEIAQMPL